MGGDIVKETCRDRKDTLQNEKFWGSREYQTHWIYVFIFNGISFYPETDISGSKYQEFMISGGVDIS